MVRFRGMAITAPVAWRPFTEEDYLRIKALGVNSILYKLWWTGAEIDGGIEPFEDQVGYYSEATLSRLEEQIALARKVGLKPFIGVQNSNFQTGSSRYVGWADIYGGDGINLDTAMRERYCNMLRMLAQRFPNVGLDVWSFPYHAEPELFPSEERERTFYEVTQPLLLKTVREVSSTVPVILNPLKQGIGIKDATSSGELDVQPYHNDPNVFYGINSHNGGYGGVCRVGTEWDYDYDRLEQNFAAVGRFKAKYPKAHVACVEWIGLVIHGAVPDRPILQSRLDWCRALFEKAKELNIDWFYHCYTQGLPEHPYEADNSETAISQMIAEYAPIPAAPVEVSGGMILALVIILLALLAAAFKGGEK